MQNRFMTFHHTQETKCPQCGEVVALEEKFSYVVDTNGQIVMARNQYPFPLAFSVLCDNGHKVEFSTNEALSHGSTTEPPTGPFQRLAVTLETPLP